MRSSGMNRECERDCDGYELRELPALGLLELELLDEGEGVDAVLPEEEPESAVEAAGLLLLESDLPSEAAAETSVLPSDLPAESADWAALPPDFA